MKDNQPLIEHQVRIDADVLDYYSHLHIKLNFEFSSLAGFLFLHF